MSVIIKDMEIPKSCGDCPLNHDEMSCIVTGTRWRSDTMILLDFDYTKERLYDCPLSEVLSAQPEIIYCGECKHMLPNGRCLAFADLSIRPMASDYCSKGVRK